MSPNQFSVSLVTLTTLLGFACAAVPRAAIPTSVNGASYNKASAGPSTTWFAGATSLPAAKIASAAAKATKVPSDATYILQAGGSAKATIHSDWSGLSKVCMTISSELNNILLIQIIGGSLRFCCRYGCRL